MLDGLPKTPKGKYTKQVINAKCALDAKLAESANALDAAGKAFNERLNDIVGEAARGLHCFALVEKTLKHLSYTYDEECTSQLRHAYGLISQFNELPESERDGKRRIEQDYFFGNTDYAFRFDSKLPGKGDLLIVRIRPNNVFVRYIGPDAPVVDGYGPNLRREDNCFTSFGQPEHGKNSVNLSAIGTESFAECESRLERILEGIRIQRAINTNHPKVLDDNLWLTSSNYDVAKGLAEVPGSYLGLARHPENRSLLIPVAYTDPNQDVLFSTKPD